MQIYQNIHLILPFLKFSNLKYIFNDHIEVGQIIINLPVKSSRKILTYPIYTKEKYNNIFIVEYLYGTKPHFFSLTHEKKKLDHHYKPNLPYNYVVENHQ
jgi:hypothetical protein